MARGSQRGRGLYGNCDLMVGILRWVELASRERHVAEGKSNDVGEGGWDF